MRAPRIPAAAPGSRADASTAVPLAVSQLTSESVLGIDGRRYLEHLRRHPEIPRRRVGRLVVSAVADWLPTSTAATTKPASSWSADAAIAKAVGA